MKTEKLQKSHESCWGSDEAGGPSSSALEAVSPSLWETAWREAAHSEISRSSPGVNLGLWYSHNQRHTKRFITAPNWKWVRSSPRMGYSPAMKIHPWWTDKQPPNDDQKNGVRKTMYAMIIFKYKNGPPQNTLLGDAGCYLREWKERAVSGRSAWKGPPGAGDVVSHPLNLDCGCAGVHIAIILSIVHTCFLHSSVHTVRYIWQYERVRGVWEESPSLGPAVFLPRTYLSQRNNPKEEKNDGQRFPLPLNIEEKKNWKPPKCSIRGGGL